jgi:hypothetical protein
MFRIAKLNSLPMSNLLIPKISLFKYSKHYMKILEREFDIDLIYIFELMYLP